MQKTILWGVIGVLVIGLGVVVYSLNSDEGSEQVGTIDLESQTVQTENDPIDPTGVFSGTGTLKSIFGMGDSFFCTYTYTDPEFGNGEGTGYFDSERMRVEGTYTQNGVAFQTHMINDGTKIYSWSDSAEGEFAFVMDVGDDENNATTPKDTVEYDTPSQGTETLDETVTYECKRWQADNAVFVPPSDINFVDLQAMMQASFEGMVMPQ